VRTFTVGASWIQAAAGATYTLSGSAGNETLTIHNGVITLLANASDAGHPNLHVVVETGGSVVFNTAQHIADLTIGNGASAAMAAGASKTMLLNNITLAATARFDIRNSAMVVRGGNAGIFNGTTYDGVTGDIARAYNFSSWDGDGIRTSMSQALEGLTTVGIANADDAGVSGTDWRGVSLVSGDIIVMYTYAGDMNLDGFVDASDYGYIDNYYQFPGTSGYGNGDLNFDGIIDAGDYGYIDNSYQLQGPPL
jgi:hypothetical protein